MINQENNRRQQTADREIQEYIKQSLEALKKQVKTIDERLAKCVQADTANARKVEILVSVKGVGPVAVSTILANTFSAPREALPPHDDRIQNVFLPRMEKALNQTERILERLA